ncbi:phosphotransferase enzyme family protein [Ruegeria sp. Ofav3-42]|uniref:phosphotransferase enzyme family protein n=1 Tax=Ruegeria sp. Ofav3-42 TaxID=2917759 RepID=UPI001EF457E3|nr:phosphotransferase [Ruegeria sp. Ofav3-42]MCG7521490.1 phosphotransferase [Ruegeria sp. Ofav3-42]
MTVAETIEKTLTLWGFEGADCRLIAERENRVFRVNHQGNAYALRLHRPGYRTDAELWSELELVAALAKGGLYVPAPIASASGKFLHVVDGIQIDVLAWLSGAPVGKTGTTLDIGDRAGLFRGIGREMARMHVLTDAWTPPESFTRCAWGRAGLVGENPVWDRFWDNPTLSDEDRTLFLKVRKVADQELQRLEPDLDYGLIHADLVRENVLVDGDNLQLIDFDDSGFGFRLFDLATTLLKNHDEPDYPELRAALIEGYRSVRDIDTTALDLFVLLRSATYVGWIITRMEEDGSEIRNERFTHNTRKLAETYLAGREESS